MSNEQLLKIYSHNIGKAIMELEELTLLVEEDIVLDKVDKIIKILEDYGDYE